MSDRNLSIREALNEALVEEMEKDERIFLMGEEVGYYDGAYKVSRGLLKRFGCLLYTSPSPRDRG